MNVRHVYELCVVTALVILGTGFGWNAAIAAQGGPTGVGEGVEVLTRGPVHEAFAETILFDPEPGTIVTKAPPEPIEEMPPEQRPDGVNVDWIPGYWAWDDERSDFLWVSGIWRSLPPGRQWVPGYWGRSDRGLLWVSGYWADARDSEVEYLPEPPDTVEIGPNIAAPSANDIWIPGCWVWHQDRYAWRPGYWAEGRPDWDWVPAHYVYAPRGYVFVDSYWDYSVARRGVLFAPVYVDAGVYTRPGFSYSPTVVIDLNAFTDHLFLRPHYQHYYFGDYYAASYQDAGFRPWFSFYSSHNGYDPIYAHQRWEHRQDGEWEHNVQVQYQSRRDHEDARPPRTWAAQVQLSTGGGEPRAKSLIVATSLDQLAKAKDSPLRFRPVAKEERQQLGKRGQEVQGFRATRQKVETEAVPPAADKAAKQPGPIKVKLPRSPIVAKSADQLGKDHAPPKPHEAPKPDPKVEPTKKSKGVSKDKDKDKEKDKDNKKP